MTLLIPTLSPGVRICIHDHNYELFEHTNNEARMVPFLVLKRIPDLTYDAVLDPADYFTYKGHLYQVKPDGKSLLCHGYLAEHKAVQV